MHTRIGKSMSKGALAFRLWRTKTGTTQFQASTLLGYDKFTRLERGDYRPSLPLALRIQALTGISLNLWVVPLDRADQETLAELEEQLEGRMRGPRKSAAPAAAPTGRKRRRRPKARAVA